MLKISWILFGLSAMLTPVIVSLSPGEINTSAKESTVRVNGQNSGSGVIYKKDGNHYYVLTAQHVVETPDEYEVITADEQIHPLNYAEVSPLPETDLAIVEFVSEQDYALAELGDSDNITEGDAVFIAGWPHAGEAIPYIYQFITGSISGLPPRPLPGGYGLIYTSTARQGMSGGPVFDSEGAVVGIHGRAEGKEIYLPGSNFDSTTIRDGFSLGVPINVFLEKTLAPIASEPVDRAVLPVVEPEVVQRVQERARNREIFERSPVLDRRVKIPNNSQFRQSEYLFTIDHPAEAGAPIQEIVFAQTEGADYPSFSTRDTHAYEGDDSSAKLPLGLVSQDRDKRTMTVVFDPPVEPGRKITVALKAHRNPRDGTYIYSVTAFPPGTASEGRRVGTGRLQFYEPQTF